MANSPKLPRWLRITGKPSGPANTNVRWGRKWLSLGIGPPSALKNRGPRFRGDDGVSVHGFDRDAENVACAALGLDVARVARIALDLASQAQDLHVDRAVEHLVVVQAREVEQLVARENPVRRAEQHDEQAEFAVGERHGLPVRTAEAPKVEVELPAVE